MAARFPQTTQDIADVATVLVLAKIVDQRNQILFDELVAGVER
jgi:hypothetical protein